MPDQPGMRIVAVLKSDAKQVWLLGHGVYEGDHPRPGWVESGERDSYVRIMDADPEESPPSGPERDAPLHHLSLNPRLRLDSGQVVWGCECWWSQEEGFVQWVNGRKIVPAEVTAWISSS